jgi:hypothetical protein
VYGEYEVRTAVAINFHDMHPARVGRHDDAAFRRPDRFKLSLTISQEQQAHSTIHTANFQLRAVKVLRQDHIGMSV